MIGYLSFLRWGRRSAAYSQSERCQGNDHALTGSVAAASDKTPAGRVGSKLVIFCLDGGSDKVRSSTISTRPSVKHNRTTTCYAVRGDIQYLILLAMPLL